MSVDEGIELERLAVVTIQGGGVYGLTVAGQLDRVINHFRLNPMAIAGTSAGAIVAALYWSGMSPSDIRNAFESLAERGEIINLLGPADGNSLSFNQLIGMKAEWDELAKEVNSSSTTPFLQRNTLSQIYTGLTKGLPFYHKHRGVLDNVKHRGLFSGDKLEETIQNLMWSSMEPFHPDLRKIMGKDKELRFKHIQQLQDQRDILFPALFITATNLRTGTIEVFNSLDQKYADTPVARAARASGSFPFVFRPVQVPTADTNDWYVDGGVISNFPVWIFGQEFRKTLSKAPKYQGAAQRPWIHIGLRREPSDQQAKVDLTDPSKFGSTMVSLLTGGARDTLEERIAAEMTSVRTVRQPEAMTGGPKSVLDVSKITKDKVREMFLKGAWYARRELNPMSFHIPDDARNEINFELCALVQRCNLVFSRPDNTDCDFRSNLYLPKAGKLYRRFWCNMDPPSGHAFDFDTGLTGYCFKHRVPMSCNLQLLRKAVEDGNQGDHTFGMTKESHLMVKEDRTWLVSMPVFDPNEFIVPAVTERDVIPDGSPYHYVLPRVLEGVIYGVMNIDAHIDYTAFNISPDPESSSTDARLSAIIDLARVSAARIGRRLAICFGGKERSHAAAQ